MENDLRRYKNEVHATIRSLLETGYERNNDKEFSFCSLLLVFFNYNERKTNLHDSIENETN